MIWGPRYLRMGNYAAAEAQLNRSVAALKPSALNYSNLGTFYYYQSRRNFRDAARFRISRRCPRKATNFVLLLGQSGGCLPVDVRNFLGEGAGMAYGKAVFYGWQKENWRPTRTTAIYGRASARITTPLSAIRLRPSGRSRRGSSPFAPTTATFSFESAADRRTIPINRHRRPGRTYGPLFSAGYPQEEIRKAPATFAELLRADSEIRLPVWIPRSKKVG